jgi:hypothetical protein
VITKYPPEKNIQEAARSLFQNVNSFSLSVSTPTAKLATQRRISRIIENIVIQKEKLGVKAPGPA